MFENKKLDINHLEHLISQFKSNNYLISKYNLVLYEYRYSIQDIEHNS